MVYDRLSDSGWIDQVGSFPFQLGNFVLREIFTQLFVDEIVKLFRVPTPMVSELGS